MRRRRLLHRLSQGALNNIRFTDITDLAEGLGVQLVRVRSTDHIYAHPEIPELVNFHRVRGEAKPYQIRQLIRLAELYNLQLEDQE